MPTQAPTLDKALADLRDAIVEQLRIPAILDWLGAHIPAWADRLPRLPRWMNVINILALWVVLKGALLAYIFLA